jgi:ribosome-associated translation inhibitor RaiA
LKLQVNSDKNIKVDDRVVKFVRNKADQALKPFKTKLTRVEFHLSDVNSHKFGAQDKRCMIEARAAGRRPLGVTATAGTVRAAIHGSLSKLQSALEKYFGRLATSSKKAKTAAFLTRRATVAAGSAKRVASKKTTGSKRVAPRTVNAVSEPKKKAIYQARRKSWPMRRAA